MTRGSWVLFIAAAVVLADCSPDLPPDIRRPSVVFLTGPLDTVPAPSAPDTVRKGVPFTVTFTTVYNSSICWQPDGDSITPNPVLTELGLTKVRLTTIVPMEAWVLPPGYAGPCELLQEGVRSVQVTLATPGIDTIRLVGRPFPPITANLLDTASFTVFVLP